MQKVAAGNIYNLSDLERYLNQQLRKNPGWKIEHICMVERGDYGSGFIAVFEGPDDTEGPTVHTYVDDESFDESDEPSDE